MKRYELSIGDNRISYLDNRIKSKNTLIFIHGNSLSSKTFLPQFHDYNLNKYRLIALDLPGHGNSTQAKDPEKTYSLPGFISILLRFVDKLNLHNAVFVGNSLGGHIILDAATRLTTAKAFVIIGTPPISLPPDMGKYFLPNPVLPLIYKPNLTNNEINNLAAAYLKKNIKKPDIIIEDIKRTHGLMRAYLGASLTPENLVNEVEILENIEKPILIFHGNDDQLVNVNYFEELIIPTLWQKQVKIINNAGHCPQLENSNDFNSLLSEFLNSIYYEI